MAKDPAFLLSRISLGDRQAFRQLYEATSPRLHAIALGLLRRHDDAEEVLQDVYVGLWQNASHYSPDDGPVQVWLNTLVRKRCLDRLRQADRQAGDGARLTSEPPAPLHTRMTDRDSKTLTRCLEQLDAHDLESLSLAYFEGMTPAALAAQLDIPARTVRTRIRRGLQQLRRYLPT
ncbi:MAG TPA: sigma-70 family RNA polymerase sigma factor [Fluviicoccus sp.]|nr:sigma-70 family RNA polymerase sigma factor [Fluviicoccus sp.]